MRFDRLQRTKELLIVGAAILIASCAQQPTKPAPTPSPPQAGTKAPSTPPSTSAPKPKPKPKPTPTTTPDTAETEPAPAPAESIERSKVGYYFDTLQGRLRQIANSNFVVSRHDNTIEIDATRSVLFDNEHESPQCSSLAPLAKALVEYRMTHVIVDVAAGTGEATSLHSAKSQSESIAKCLADAGVASRRIVAQGVSGTTRAITLRIEPTVRSP